MVCSFFFRECDNFRLCFDAEPGFKRESRYPPRGGGVLPYERLMGMCRWMGSHFHDWIDNNGVAFSIELLEWGHKSSDFGGK